MEYDEFLKLNKRYRMGCEWDNSLSECNKDSAFIIADSYRTAIYWHKDKFEVLFYGREKYIPELKKLKIEFEHTSESEGGGFEHTYFIDWKYFEKCIKIFKPKLSPKNSVNPFSVRNKNIFLRFMRNIDYEYYDTLLAKNIADE